MLSELTNLREKLQAERGVIQTKLDAIGVLLGETVPPAVAAVAVKVRTVRAAPVSAAKRTAGGPTWAARVKQEAMRDAIERAGETFTGEELIEKFGLKENVSRVCSNLSNYATRGWLTIARAGKPNYPAIYRRGPGWAAFVKRFHVEPLIVAVKEGPLSPRRGEGVAALASPAPSPAAPAVTAPPREENPGQMDRGGFKVRKPTEEAMEKAVTEYFRRETGPISRGQLIAELKGEHPVLFRDVPQVQQLSVLLMEMAGLGKIQRLGHGAASYFRRANAAPDEVG